MRSCRRRPSARPCVCGGVLYDETYFFSPKTSLAATAARARLAPMAMSACFLSKPLSSTWFLAMSAPARDVAIMTFFTFVRVFSSVEPAVTASMAALAMLAKPSHWPTPFSDAVGLVWP